MDEATFFFPARETTFVVGKSGSGKSTIGALLLAFYQAQSGRVLIDGRDIRKYETEWLRNNINLVQQDTYLFSHTVEDNVRLSAKHGQAFSFPQVQECVEFAQLEDTIVEMPDGLNTTVGNGGSSLSGGQRQRVALARARLSDTPILILDECTNALDETARVKVMNAIRSWRHDQTTIIITHVLSQIAAGDFAYALKDGFVIAEGYRGAVEAALVEINEAAMTGRR